MAVHRIDIVKLSGIFGVAILMMIGTQVGARSEHQIGGRTASVVFADPDLAGLARAACVGDAASAGSAIHSGVDPNGAGMQNFTPLGWAVSCGNLAGVKALLEGGGAPNRLMGDAYSPTFLAAGSPNPEVLQLLLEHGGDPNATDERNGDTALSKAFLRGAHGQGWECYYILLDGGADINKVDRYGLTIANTVLGADHYDKLVELLVRGYNQNLEFLARRIGLDSENEARGLHPDFGDQAASRQKVILLLETRGLKVRAMPEIDLNQPEGEYEANRVMGE